MFKEFFSLFLVYLNPLFHCIENNQPRCLHELLKIPNLSIKCKVDGQEVSSFLFAAQEGHLKCIQELLKYPSVDVNESNPIGWTALHVAAQAGNLALIKLLMNTPQINKQPKDKKGVCF